jgi:hypothetical protein
MTARLLVAIPVYLLARLLLPAPFAQAKRQPDAWTRRKS